MINILPKFTVVTVAYNSEKTIRDTIESVLSQTYKNLEYIIIDGQSTDSTLDIVKSYGDRIKWVSESDSGMYEAMNKGIKMANGEWIHLLNSDDFYTSDTILEEIIPRLEKNCTNYCSMYQLWPSGRRRLLEYSIKNWPRQKWQLYWAAYLPHPGLVVSATQYKNVGLYETRWRIAGDHDLILRLLEKYPPYLINKPLTNMRIGGLSAQQLRRSAYEFMEVTIKHGLPRWVAYSIFRAKLIIWKLRHKRFWEGSDASLSSDRSS